MATSDSPNEGEVRRAVSLLGQLSSQCEQMVTSLQSTKEHVTSSQEFSTGKGMSFLDLKHQMLMNYLWNLGDVIWRKVSGSKLKGDSSVERLCQIRTVIEKMRPIEHKLRYQVDKLLTAQAKGDTDASDPLRFRPRAENLVAKVDEESSNEEADDDDENALSSHPKKYVPPKIAEAYYDGDMTREDRKKRDVERDRKRALQTSVIRELKEQYGDEPEEIFEDLNLHRVREDHELTHRTEYEEGNFVRLAESKMDKARMRQLATSASLHTLAHFEKVSNLFDEADPDAEVGGQGGREGRGKKQRAAKGKKKRGRKAGKRKKRLAK